jgi:DNA-binding IclR family transcriptional regulator
MVTSIGKLEVGTAARRQRRDAASTVHVGAGELLVREESDVPQRGQSMMDRVLRVLEALKAAGDGLTVSEIARHSLIPTASAHRIVGELVELGFLDRNADRRVRIGTRLWEIVARSSAVFTLREIALPYMEDLRSVVDAPTLLSVLDHNDAINVCTLSPRQASATNVTKPGVRLPVLASSPGIILVAFAPPSAQQDILATARITRFTEHTVVDRRELARITSDARRLGYVIVRGWMSADSTGVAVPVLAEDGSALAALSVTIPFEDATPSRLLPALRTTSRGISRAFRVGGSQVDPRIATLMQRIRQATELV